MTTRPDIDSTVFWRRQASSEGRPPRVLIRVFVGPGELAETVARYERVEETEADGLFSFGALRLASVGSYLIIEGSEEDLTPYRPTTGTVLVDDIGPYHQRLLSAGAEIILGPAPAPTGAHLNARLPDGTVVEYVQHRPTADGT